MVIVLMLAACAEGTTNPSMVTDTRILAAALNPPEPLPGEQIQANVLTANPQQRDLQFMAWTCTPVADECLEAQLNAIEDWIRLRTSGDGPSMSIGHGNNSPTPDHKIFELNDMVPEEIRSVLEETNAEVETRLWLLACPVGDCRVIDEAMDEAGLPPSDRLARDLGDPSRWMDELPMDSVSLATLSVKIASQVEEDRNHNPVFEARFLAAAEPSLVLPVSGELQLSFAAADDDNNRITARAYTSVGSLDSGVEQVNSGTVRFYLQAPAQPAEGRVYVVFSDGHGGATWWTMPVEVQ